MSNEYSTINQHAIWKIFHPNPSSFKEEFTMKLSENQELVQKLKQILGEYPGLEYDEHGSARIDDGLIVKVSPDTICNVGTAGYIAKVLSDSTNNHYKTQLLADSDRFRLENLRGFKLILQKSNRNVRITYPDSKDGTLEVDIIEGMEMSLNLDDPKLWYFAEGANLEVHLNIFAQPNYRKFLRTHIIGFTRNSNKSSDGDHFSNSELKQIIDDDTASRD